MNNWAVKKKGRVQTLTFSNSILKEDIRDLKEVLIKAIDQSKTINIAFNNLKKTDIFFVQLLCAAHKYAFSKKKSIIIPEIPEILKKVLTDNGLYREKGCLAENEQDCFWLREVTNA